MGLVHDWSEKFSVPEKVLSNFEKGHKYTWCSAQNQFEYFECHRMVVDVTYQY